MLFPIIKVKDKRTGREHIVGTNTHDQLLIDVETGGIQYLNLQNMCGTEIIDGESEYEFVGIEDDFNLCYQIEFVTFDELIEIYKKQINLSQETERRIRDAIKKVIMEGREKYKLDEDPEYSHHTGGGYQY